MMMVTKLKSVKEAYIVWNHLNGIVNIFKPAGMKAKHLKHAIIGNMLKDLNQLEVRPMRQIPMSTNLLDNASYENELVMNSDVNTTTTTTVPINKSLLLPLTTVAIETLPTTTTAATSTIFKPDLSDHILAVGPRYQAEDVRSGYAQTLGDNTSGVILLGINKGTKLSYRLGHSKLLRAYHVTGKLGVSTETNFNNSRTIARATYNHIWPDKLQSLLASIQASHQRKMYELCGVDLQSQTAYEIACRGLIRPANNSLPIVYGLRCIKFNRPEFIIEVHAINEDESYLCQLIQEIGLQLHSVAHCTGIRCVRHGQFNVDDSLLTGNWTLQNIVTNLELNRKILEKYPKLLNQTSATLN